MTHSESTTSFGKPRKATIVQIGGALGIAGTMIALFIFLVALFDFRAVFMLAPLAVVFGSIGSVMSIVGAVLHPHSGADDTQPISALFVSFMAVVAGLLLWGFRS